MKLSIKEDEDLLNSKILKSQASASRGIATSILAEGMSLATEGIKFLIELDQKKYTASYSSGKNELYFYNNISLKGAMDPEGMQFDGIKLLRQAQIKNDFIDTTLYIAFKVDLDNPYEIINNGIFRLQLDEFVLKNSKAKVPTSKWFLPWTLIYNKEKDLNLDIEIIVLGTWITNSGQIYSNFELGKFLMELRNVPMDRIKQKDYFNSMKDKTLNGFSFIAPRSFGFYKSMGNDLMPSYGQGLYDIRINVKESSKDKFIEKIVKDNYSIILDNLKSIKK
ncbi:MAG: hypothetical protein OEY34_04835 [Cyclobacteriaceae bacterium]|nr:hypothetical protein [Cyclobacteriaceae bacterium]